MARMVARVALEGHKKEFTFTELTVDQLIALIQDEDLFTGLEKGKGAEQLKSLKDKAAELLPMFSNVTLDDIVGTDSKAGLAPSELLQLWDEGFAKANSVFFDMWRRAGLDKMLLQLKDSIMRDLTTILTATYSKQLAGSSKPGTPTP